MRFHALDGGRTRDFGGLGEGEGKSRSEGRGLAFDGNARSDRYHEERRVCGLFGQREVAKLNGLAQQGNPKVFFMVVESPQPQNLKVVKSPIA